MDFSPLLKFIAELQVPEPRMTDWKVGGWGTSQLGVDVADVVSGGATYALPVQVNLTAGTAELKLHNPVSDTRLTISGTGGGIGVGAGWSLLPGVAGKSNSLRKSPAAKWFIEQVEGNTTSSGAGAVSNAADLPNGSIGNVAAINAGKGTLTAEDFEGVMTLVGGQVNFGTNGIGMGAALFADEPISKVHSPLQLWGVRAIALLWDIHITAGAVDVTADHAFFTTSVRKAKADPFDEGKWMCTVKEAAA